MTDDLIFADAAEPVFGAQLGMTLLRTHGPAACGGPPDANGNPICCIHNQSGHHMRTWRQNWRGDRGLMERLCPHGIGHPDPDDIAYKRHAKGERFAYYEGVHGCDGCCRPAPHVDEEKP